MKPTLVLTAILSALILTSCARDDNLRTEGTTLGVGDAIARNRMLQVIDPWPQGVEDTDLLIPNSRTNDVVGGASETATPAATTP